MDATDALVTWFIEEFRKRTEQRETNVYWALPGTRISSHETIAKAKELGIPEANEGMMFLIWWRPIFEKQVRKPCAKICKEFGEKPMAPLDQCSKDTLKNWGI